MSITTSYCWFLWLSSISISLYTIPHTTIQKTGTIRLLTVQCTFLPLLVSHHLLFYSFYGITASPTCYASISCKTNIYHICPRLSIWFIWITQRAEGQMHTALILLPKPKPQFLTRWYVVVTNIRRQPPWNVKSYLLCCLHSVLYQRPLG